MKQIGFQLLALDARYPLPVAEEASGIWKGRDFTRWSIRKGREICHLGLWKGSKGWAGEFYGSIKPKKRSILAIDSYLNDSAFQSSQERLRVNIN